MGILIKKAFPEDTPSRPPRPSAICQCSAKIRQICQALAKCKKRAGRNFAPRSKLRGDPIIATGEPVEVGW